MGSADKLSKKEVEKKYPVKEYKKTKDWEWEHPGRPTGSIPKLVEAPVKWLLTLPGLRGEHKVLSYDMPKIKKLSELVQDPQWRRDYAVEIGVQHDGKAYVDDGNHRIRAAKLAGLSTYPVKIKFYGGGEDNFKLHEVFKKYAAIHNVVDMAQQVMNSGVDWGKMFEQLVHNKPVVDGLVNKVKSTVPQIPPIPKGVSPTMDEKVAKLQQLVAKAKIAIEAGLPHESVLEELKKFAIENDIGGNPDQYGAPVSQDYAADSTQGADYAGENDPNKGDQRRTGPREPNDMVQEASSNKPCPSCGMPTDKCNCMKSEQPRNGNNPVNTAPSVDPALDPTKKVAFDLLTSMIAAHGKMTREASNVQEIEIPFKDLNLEDGVNYHMSGRVQEAAMSIDKYLKAHVFPHTPYTIATMEQTMNKMYVKVIVFDRQIEHEANDTKAGSLRKVSNVQSQKLQKTAWKRRLTEVIGENDDTGLVRCPIEGGFLTRSCGTCPFAGNPHTYAVDGGVECHFDEGPVWLANLGVKEHRPLDSSSNR